MVLSWDEPSETRTPVLPVTNYEYRTSTDAGANWSSWTSTGTDRAVAFDCGGSGATCSYEVRATNERGTGPAASISGDGFADTTDPVVTLQTPKNGANVDNEAGSALTYTGLAGTALGDDTSVSVRVLDNSMSVVQGPFAGTVTGGVFSATAPAGITTPGVYTVEVSQGDWDGNSGSDTMKVEVRDAVFVAVAPIGNDANPGTAASPKATVAAALAAPEAQVAVGYGVYDEGAGGLALVSNKSILGGFGQYTDWTRPGTAGTVGEADNFESQITGTGQAALASGDTGVVLDGLSLLGSNAGLGAGRQRLRPAGRRVAPTSRSTTP